MNKEKIVDYLDKQFWKHKRYECMPENETGYEYVPREALSKIVDGLIPMVKAELKNCSIPDVMWRSGQPCNCTKNDYLTIVDGECICVTCGGTVVVQGCT